MDDGDRLPSAIVEATESDDVDSLKLLLKYEKEEEYREELGLALSIATTPEIVSLLLDSGAEVDEIGDAFGTTLLVEASSAGRVEAVKLLLSHGAKKYLPEALIEAIVNGHASIIKLLTQHGAQVDDESWLDFHSLDEKPAIVSIGYITR